MKGKLISLLSTASFYMGLALYVIITVQYFPPAYGYEFLDNNTRVHFNKRIEQFRKGTFTLEIVDHKGNPANAATVTIEQKSHAFFFGGALFTPLFENRMDEASRIRILEKANEMFNIVVDGNGFKWKTIEPARGNTKYGFFRHLKSTKWAIANDKQLRHHCLFWSNPKFNPDWLTPLNRSDFKRAMLERIQYTREITGEHLKSIDVINEMLYFNLYRDKLGEDIVKEIFEETKRAFPQARLYLNEFPPQKDRYFSCYDNYINLIKTLKKNKVPFSGVGLQAHMSQSIFRENNISVPDFIKDYDKILYRLSQTAGFPVFITEYNMKTKDEQFRADFLEAFYTMAFSHPHVEGIIAWEWFGEERLKALVKNDGTLTKAGVKFCDLVFSKWWTKNSMATDHSGNVSFNAFYGNYEITVTKNNTRIRKALTLSPKTPTPIRVSIPMGQTL